MFGRQRREKIFGVGTGRGLDKNAKARIMVYARGWSARHRTKRQHKGPITRAYMEVLWAILYRCHNSNTGLCFPSKATIARRAGCSVDTVNEAIKVLELAGILTWSHRIYRKNFKYTDAFGQILIGSTVLRTSNAYIFTDKIGGNSKLTENPTQKLDSNIINKVERVVDPNDPLEMALSGLGKALSNKEMLLSRGAVVELKDHTAS